MNIAVLIKQVPVSNDVSVDPETHALIRSSSESMINPADLNAIEEAIVLKEKTDGQVVVFTMGPPNAEESLRTAMAIGCDAACLMTDRCLAGGDTIATARVLAEGIKKFGTFDLILSGALSSDGATGQVGAMVAEYLSVPHVTEIQGILSEANDLSITEMQVMKRYQNTKARIRCKLPALFTVNFGCNEPRLPTLRTKRAAKTKPLTVYTNEQLQMPAEKIGLAGSPTMVTDSFAPEHKKQAQMLKGSTAEIVAQMKELLEKQKGSN